MREVKDSQYANVPGADYRFEVADSRGRQIVARTVTLSAFGTFSERLPLDEGAPIGTYRVRLYQPGKSEFAGQFEVQSYQLQPIDLTFDPVGQPGHPGGPGRGAAGAIRVPCALSVLTGPAATVIGVLLHCALTSGHQEGGRPPAGQGGRPFRPAAHPPRWQCAAGRR